MDQSDVAYTHWLRENTDLASTTIMLYTKVVRLMYEYLKDEDSLDKINAFLARCSRKGMYYAKFAIIKWLEFCGRASDIQNIIRVRTPRGRKRSINILTADQYERLLDRLPPPHKDVFLLCFWTGLRASEALKIKRKDIQYSNDRKAYLISLRGKGNKGAVVAYSSHQADLLDKYMSLRPAAYLFLDKDCEELNEYDLRPRLASHYNQYWKALRQAGLDIGIPNLSTHDARRTFGTRIRNLKDVAAAQRALRHSEISTTIRYLPNDSAEEAVDAMLSLQEGRSELVRGDNQEGG